MVNRVALKDKKKPGPNFLINIPITIPIKFSTSTTEKIYKEFKKNIKKNDDILSDILRKYIYEVNGVSSIEEYVNEVPKIKLMVKELKDEIAKSVTRTNQEEIKSFSSMVEEMMIAYIDERNKNGK